MRLLVSLVSSVVLVSFLAGCGGGSNPELPAPRIGWAVGMAAVDGQGVSYGTIVKTQDGGSTWVRQGDSDTIPDVDIADVAAVDAMHAWVVGESSPGVGGAPYGTILHTADGGATWQRQGSAQTIPDAGVEGVAAVNGMLAWVACSNGAIFQTQDGGISWVPQAEGAFPDAMFEMVSAADADHVWAVGQQGSGEDIRCILVRTIDGGATWEEVLLPMLDDAPGLIDVHAVSPDVIWAVGTNSTIVVTINGGDNWMRTNTFVGLLHVNGVCALDAFRAWIAVDSFSVFYTDDGGFTWTRQNQPVTPAATLAGAYMGLTAMEGGDVWMVGFNSPSEPDKPVMLYTADGGTNWAPQACPANSILRRVSFAGAVR